MFRSIKLTNRETRTYEGGDGGWYGQMEAQFEGEFQINQIEVSTEDEDLDETTENSIVDSTWRKMTLSKNGKFTLQEIKRRSNQNISR